MQDKDGFPWIKLIICNPYYLAAVIHEAKTAASWNPQERQTMKGRTRSNGLSIL